MIKTRLTIRECKKSHKKIKLSVPMTPAARGGTGRSVKI